MGALTNREVYTPTPFVTAAAWETKFVTVNTTFRVGAVDTVYTVDELCMWTVDYSRVAGITRVDQIEGMDICEGVYCQLIPRCLFLVGYGLVSIIYVLALVGSLLLYVHRSKRIIQLAQPFFLGLVILGTVINTTSIIFLSRDSQDYTDAELDAACIAWPWLLALGHMITTATLVAKMHRVRRVCMAGGSGNSMRKSKVTIKEVSAFIVVCLLFDILVLGVWYGVDPFLWTLQSVSFEADGYMTEVYGHCASSEAWAVLFPFLLLAWHFGVLIYANWLTYATCQLHKISDSKHVAIALFNSIELLLVGVPLLILFQGNVAASYLVLVLFVFLNNIWVLGLVVYGKLYLCLTGRGDSLPDFHRVRGSTRMSGLDPGSEDARRLANLELQFSEESKEQSTGSSEEFRKRCPPDEHASGK